MDGREIFLLAGGLAELADKRCAGVVRGKEAVPHSPVFIPAGDEGLLAGRLSERYVFSWQSNSTRVICQS